MVAHPRTPLRVDRLRALNLPQPVEVRTDPGGLPVAIRFPAPRSPHTRSRGYAPSILRQDTARAANTTGGIATPNPEEWKVLEAIIEIWRVDDEWWRKPVSRLYVEAVLEGGKRVLLYRDLVSGQWFAQNP